MACFFVTQLAECFRASRECYFTADTHVMVLHFPFCLFNNTKKTH